MALPTESGDPPVSLVDQSKPMGNLATLRVDQLKLSGSRPRCLL